MAARPDVKQLLLQVDASVELARRNIASLQQSVANDTGKMERSLDRLGGPNGSATVLGRAFGGVQAQGLGMLRTFAGGTLTVAGFGLALMSAVRDADALAEKIRVMNAVIDATGNKTGLSKVQLIDFSETMENSFAIAQEEILAAQTALAQYDGVAGSTFTRSIKLSADMAAVFGGDLAGNAEKLGGALQNLATGNVEGLARGFKFLGTETLDAVKKLAEAGKAAEAQDLLLKSLEQRLGGAGQAKAQGLTGAWFRFTDAIADGTRKMLEQIGVMPTWIRWLNGAADAINGEEKSTAQRGADARLEATQAREALEAARRKASRPGGGGLFAENEVRRWEKVVAYWDGVANRYIAAARSEVRERDRLQKEAEAAAKKAAAEAKKNAEENGPKLSPGDAITAARRAELLSDARRLVGAREGSASLQDLFRQANVNVDPKMVAWCAAFVNAVLATNGLPGTGSLSARSFLNYGSGTDTPEKGDIVVLSRGKNQAVGHVGFFEGFDPKGNVRVTGGNQGDRVSTDSFARSRVLGFRRAPDLGQVLGDAAKEPSLEELRGAQHEDRLPFGIDFDKTLVDLDSVMGKMVDIDGLISDMPEMALLREEDIARFEDFKDGLAGIAEDVLRVGAGLEDWTIGDLVDRFKELVIQLLVIEPIVQRIRDSMSGWKLGGGGGGGILGLFSSATSLFGAAAGASGGLSRGAGGISARAAGGPVAADNLYMVGERGPELFVPRTPGTIVPNHALGGGVTVIVNAQDTVVTGQVRQWVAEGIEIASVRGAMGGAQLARVQSGKALRRRLA